MNCSSLLLLPDISKWDTRKITNFDSLFDGCQSLLYLPNISNWKINENVKKENFPISLNSKDKNRLDILSSSFNIPTSEESLTLVDYVENKEVNLKNYNYNIIGNDQLFKKEENNDYYENFYN